MLILLIILSPMVIFSQIKRVEGKEVFHKIDQIYNYESGGKADTMWIDYVIDTIKTFIAYIDTASAEYLTMNYKPRRMIIDNSVKWMWGYKVCKRECTDKFIFDGSYFDCYYLDEHKNPLSKTIRRIQLMFVK